MSGGDRVRSGLRSRIEDGSGSGQVRIMVAGARTCADGNTFLTECGARHWHCLYTAITRLHHHYKAVIGPELRYWAVIGLL